VLPADGPFSLTVTAEIHAGEPVRTGVSLERSHTMERRTFVTLQASWIKTSSKDATLFIFNDAPLHRTPLSPSRLALEGMRRLLGLKPKKHEQKENPRDSHDAPPRPADPTPPLAEARLNAGETVVGLGLSVPRCGSPLDGLEQDERKGRHVVFDEPTGSSPPLPPVPVSVTRRPSQATKDKDNGLAAAVGLGLGADLALMRTTSPSSLAPSGGSAFSHSMGSPYLNGTGTQSSLARLSERDPTQIYGAISSGSVERSSRADAGILACSSCDLARTRRQSRVGGQRVCEGTDASGSDVGGRRERGEVRTHLHPASPSC
jgi:hypothetical protein